MSSFDRLPPVLEVQPVRGPIQGRVVVPGSKSFTNRALPIAALAQGDSLLTGVLESEDTHVMIESLRRLGIGIEQDTSRHTVRVSGCAGKIPATEAQLFLENSGTSIRFLAAVVTLGNGSYVLDGIARMRQRPIGDLLAALRSLGIDAASMEGTDCPPVRIRANGLPGGEVAVRGDVSSQFLSALLLVAPMARAPLTVVVDGPLVSQPYIDMTLSTMAAFGVAPRQVGYERFSFPGGEVYRGTDYAIEPDASAASYWFAAAAVTGGRVTVQGLGSKSTQGDLGFVRVLEQMGCKVEMDEHETTVTGGTLRGIDVDLCHLSDTVPTLAAVAALAQSTSRIRNVAHIRHKETDRIHALAVELAKLGVGIEEHADGLTIHPAPLQPGTLATYNDHRMAMSFALLGLRYAGIRIEDPRCVRKTYPEYFGELFQRTGQHL